MKVISTNRIPGRRMRRQGFENLYLTGMIEGSNSAPLYRKRHHGAIKIGYYYYFYTLRI